MQQIFQGSVYLLLATVIWGGAFVAQSVGMDYIEPFTFQFSRSVIAVICLYPIIQLINRRSETSTKWADPQLWKAGIFCGIALFLATGLQQVGLVYTDPGKAGFITAMYIVLVPIFGLFFRQKAPLTLWIGVVFAVAGLYLLSAMGVSRVNIGDVLLMLCAVAFAVQITLIDRMGDNIESLKLNLVQFLVTGILSGIVMILTETPRISNIIACAVPLLYTGVLSSAAAYSLQILGQQKLPPAQASLIMSLESVFAVLFGWLLLKQGLSGTEAAGCVLVFLGVVLSQMPSRKI